jgi:hypothetical protein
MRKFTAKDGFRAADTHYSKVAACDQLQRTSKGVMRTSSGLVTYSHLDRTHLEIDAEDLAQILREKEPHTGRMWNVKKLEKAYQNRFRSHGSWERQGVPFKVFLSLFPKTFDLFGADQDFVRVSNKSRLRALDSSQDAMISLALACQKGYVERTAPLEGTMKAGQEPKRLQHLHGVRTKTMVKSTSDPGLRSHTLPAIKEARSMLDASFSSLQIRDGPHTLPACVPFAGKERDEGGGSPSSSLRVSDMHDTRSTFRVSFQVDREGTRTSTPAFADL